jgi:uncharacterized protein (DUF1015 family)
VPEIRPLRPYRYAATDELPSLVAPPYDVIGPELRETLGERSPHNVVHIDLPEGDDDEKYARAAGLLNQWIDKGVLVRDDEPYFLTYEQTFEGTSGEPITRRGFFALVRAEPYETRQVLPHERTLSGPKVDRHKLFVATGAALSPVFLLFQDPDGATKEPIRGSDELASFSTDDGIEHRLGRVTDPAQVAAMVRSIEKQPLLIADGHHRYETTVAYGAEMDEARAKEGAEPAPRGGHHYVLAFLSDGDDPGLVVYGTHRLVFGLEGFDRDAFRKDAETFFTVEDYDGDDSGLQDALAAHGEQGQSVAARFPDGTTWLLRLRPEALERAPLKDEPRTLRHTDVVVLHTALLEGTLGITREQQASQSHLRYYKSTAKALAAIDAGEGDVLFLMNGTPVHQVRDACLAGEVMPQKSTFFHPKIPTGLAIHLLDPDEEVAQVDAE